MSWAVRALASPGRSGSAVALPLGSGPALDQSRSPALADIIGARRVRVMISSRARRILTSSRKPRLAAASITADERRSVFWRNACRFGQIVVPGA
jgi:hypothetical protein